MYRFQPVFESLRKKSVTDFRTSFGEDFGTDKGVSLDAFATLVKSGLGLDVRESDVRRAYCQIDRYSKGSVTSRELIDYLDEYEKKRMVSHDGPFETSPTLYSGVRCQDSIIQWILYPEMPDIRDEMAGHYVCVSRTGTLSVWSKDMTRRYETSIETNDEAGVGKTDTWATSLTCLGREKLLAVSTTAGDIRFFRSSIYKFEHKFSIVCLPYTVLDISCYDSQRLVCGDFSGSVYVVQFDSEFFARIAGRASHLGPEKFLYDPLKLGKVAGMSYVGTSKLHYSPVQMVEYVPALMAVISCSISTKNAMMLHSLDKNESLSFTSPAGIYCFAYSKRLSCIVTGCADHTVKIWNPSVNTSCNELLTGHQSPVDHVLVVDERLYLISSDREKTIRVWDLLRPSCLQILRFRESEFPGKQSYASLFLDLETESLIVTTYQIGRVKFHRTSCRAKTHPCSEYVVLAAYSAVYDCLVSVGNSSAVAVWDGETGRLVHQYENSHEIVDSDGVPRHVMVMTAGLDPSHRRLITADRIGTVKVWNFHLGLCLKSFQTHFTVLSLSFHGFNIYAGGSAGGVVRLYDNGREGADSMVFERRHARSVVSVDFYRQHLLATASIDGEITVWLRRNADPKFCMKDLQGGGETEGRVETDELYLARSEVARRRRCSISQLLFLQGREMEFFVANLASCGMDGRIRFWNVVSNNRVNQGRLLSKFRAVFRECDGVLCLATDQDNRHLISGDTMGYVRVYELDGYYPVYGSEPPRSTGGASPQQKAKFPFLRLQQLVQERHPKHSKFPSEDGVAELGCAPFLLNCFRAHLGAVLKVGYVGERDLLVTAGKESSVRLWTLSGAYAGRLGGSSCQPWGVAVGSHMPADVRRVASTLTLYVMNNGNMPLWTRAFKALRECRLGHQPDDFTEKPCGWKLRKSVSAEELTASGGNIEEELVQRLPYLRCTRPSRQMLFEALNSEI